MLNPLPIHVTLGIAILVVAIVRVFWRVSTLLPPWAESLSAAERRVAHYTERVLLTMLFVIPPTGLLVLRVDDDLLALHVGAHIVFFVALAAHLGLVLGRGLRGRPVCSGGCCSRAQVPVKSGLRFSEKARGPSLASLEANTFAPTTASSFQQSFSCLPSESRMVLSTA